MTLQLACSCTNKVSSKIYANFPGGTPIWKGRGNFWEILKRTLGRPIWAWLKSLLPSKRYQKTENKIYISIFPLPWRLKILAFCLERPKWDQNSEIYTPKRDNEHPHHFHMGVPLPVAPFKASLFKIRILWLSKFWQSLFLEAYGYENRKLSISSFSIQLRFVEHNGCQNFDKCPLF